MELALPGEDHPARVAFREWLAAHPDPSPMDLARSGYVGPHWPEPWGLSAGPIDQLVIDDEMRKAGIKRPQNRIGIGWAGPTILQYGTDAQRERYLLPLLAGDEIWCQLFSEPDSGSDLASLSTRAVRDGDEYVVNGQKIWTSFGHESQFGILLARTDPDARKQDGISYFICPMDAPGVTVDPIIDMTGLHAFNQVFFDDVRIPAENLVGEENGGWALAKVTLGNERVSLSGEGALWGDGPSAEALVEIVRRSGSMLTPTLAQRMVQVWSESEILRILRMRQIGAAIEGLKPGPEVSVRKAMADEHGKHLMDLAKDVAGSYGLLADAGPMEGLQGRHAGEPVLDGGGVWPALVWSMGYLYAQALTIGGGTSEVQRNIIGERILGLPREADVEEGLTWAESRARRR